MRHIPFAIAPLLILLLSAGILSAAELKDISDPAQIAKQFSPRAKLRVVNLWATWCLPCVKEIPELSAIDAEFTDSQVQMIGVSLDDAIPGERSAAKKTVQQFLGKSGVKYQNIYYTGRVPALQDQFRFWGEIPLTVVYDSSGRELSRHQGPLTRAAFSKELKKLLNRQGGR